MVPIAQWVGKQGFEVVGTGSNHSFNNIFFINTENRDTAPPPL